MKTDYIQVDAKKVPWVFWIKISLKKSGWFKSFWKTRGANFINIVLFRKIHVSIGRPWRQININYNLSEHGNLNSIQKTNEQNLKNPWSILINTN